MCGVVAIYAPHGGIEPTAMQDAMAALHHRGPDFQDSWIAPSGTAMLGHTLLSITQLGGGRQPITSADGRVAVSVNGEFYDFEPIVDDLTAKGYRFKTGSDSELPLHLYDWAGPGFLHQLRGEFAFVLWDDRNRQLFAARDRFGICPLYYAWHGGRLHLASEIKALFAAGVPAVWDSEAVYLQHHGVLLPGRTLFEGVHQVPPGHCLIASNATATLRRYWDIDFARSDDQTAPLSDAEAVERVRDRLVEAIRLRIPSSGARYGCYLSGGLDSSTVLGVVTHLAGREVPTFTIAFDDPTYDESAVAKQTAAAMGARLYELKVTQGDLADHFADTVFHCEGLLGNGGSVAKFLLSRLSHGEGFRAMITGEGADEVFGGYEEMFEAPDAWTTDPRLAIVKRVMGGKVPVWLAAGALMADRTNALLADGLKDRFADVEPLRVLFNHLDIEGQVAGRAFIDQSMYVWDKTVMANFLLRTLGDGVERAHSIEGRLPLLDHVLADTATDLPATVRIRPGRNKHLLREAARPFVTEQVYSGPKLPFLAPPSPQDGTAPFLSMLFDIVSGKAMDAVPFYDRKAVLRAVETIPTLPARERLGAERLVIRVASACVLQDRFAPAAA